MAHIILTGATGQAGAGVLSYCLSSPTISRVSILSRRPVKLAENNPKAQVIIHKDFSQYPDDVLAQLKGATGCVWAQGISSRGMQEDAYTEITVDYPMAAAKALADRLPKKDGKALNFVYISGEGANMDESKAGMMFGKIKGRAEKQILALQDEKPALNAYCVRPAIINPQGKYLAERSVTLQDRLSTGLGGLAERLWKSYVIPTDKLAHACVTLAIGDGKPVAAGPGVEAEGRLLNNVALRRVAGI